MSDFALREYETRDLPDMARVWLACFDDPESLVDKTLAMLPDMGTAVVAERAGRVVGAAYAICGMELIDGDREPPIIGYIYAVGVEPESRGLGMGSALVRACAEKAHERGAGIIATLPAEPSLYGWYENILGLSCALRRSERRIDARPAEPVMELSSTEYMLWRENMLRGRAHVHLSNHALEFACALCREYGGGFFASSSGIAAAYIENGECVIREVIAPDGDACAYVAASVGAQLGARRVRYFLPDPTGDEYVATLPGALPEDCVWNLTFD